MEFVAQKSPHIKRPDSASRMLLDVIIALAPTLLFAFFAFPLDAVRTVLLSIATMELCEYLFTVITKKSWKAFTMSNFLSAMVSAIIYALILPSNMGWDNGIGYWAVIAGAALGIALGKLVFGGLGQNIFNPAAVGMVIARVGWGGNTSSSISWIFDKAVSPIDSVTTGATVLGSTTTVSGINNANLLDLLLGNVPGALGEAFKLTILIGLVYLLVRKAIDWRLLLSYVGTFVVLMLVAGITYSIKYNGALNIGSYLAFEVLTGGFLFCAVFMITDPVTSPAGTPARIIYGMFASIIAVFLRLFVGGEGVGRALLIANCISPLLDYYQWASPRFKKWHWIAIAVLAVLGIGIVILGLAFNAGTILA